MYSYTPRGIGQNLVGKYDGTNLYVQNRKCRKTNYNISTNSCKVLNSLKKGENM